jgi:hypothetical protein
MKRLLLAICLAGALNAFAAQPDQAAAIHRDVDKLIALYTDGFGYSQAKWRHVIYGPLFKPGSKDAVVFFTLAGVELTNGHQEYVAIFAQGEGRITPVAKERPYRLVASAQVGSRWARTLNFKTATISQGRIVVRGTRWKSKDAGCCPSGQIEVVLSIADAKGGETQYPLLRQQEKPL